MEAWIGRGSAGFRLPPSRLALDPADVVALEHDGRTIEYRLVSVADPDDRSLETMRQDRDIGAVPPGAPRPTSPERPVVFGSPEVTILELPQLSEGQSPHHPQIATFAVPSPGEIAVWRSPSSDRLSFFTSFAGQASTGTLDSDFFAGPTSRFDHGNELIVDLFSGSLDSVTDLSLFGGANALAIESAPGFWENVQAGTAELIATGRYRLTRLLRGQRGTEGAMDNPTLAGARVVLLDESLSSLPIAEADLGIPRNWHIGPASRSITHETWVATSFTPEGVGLRPLSVAHVEQP